MVVVCQYMLCATRYGTKLRDCHPMYSVYAGCYPFNPRGRLKCLDCPDSAWSMAAAATIASPLHAVVVYAAVVSRLRYLYWHIGRACMPCRDSFIHCLPPTDQLRCDRPARRQSAVCLFLPRLAALFTLSPSLGHSRPQCVPRAARRYA